MKAAALTVAAAVLAAALWGSEARGAGAGDLQGASDKNRPVSKVITLLKDMLQQLEKEQEEDEEIYEKMACWCEANDKEKTKSITDAETHINDLTTKIEELTAQSARLKTEIEALEKEVAGNQASLDKATAIRKKQLAEFNAEEKELLESVAALKAAIVVLSKHHDARQNLLQVPHSEVLSMAAAVQRMLQQHASLLSRTLTHTQRKAITSFVQAPEDYFGSTPSYKQSYTPQSGEIFGILREMKETFESNLSESQKEEAANQKSYEELKAAKEAEIQAGQAQIDSKTEELADTDAKNAQSKEDIEDTRNSLSADEQFLIVVKEKCQMTDQEWEQRQKTRQQEMEAVSKALSILSSDDAHDLFTKTFNPALVQKESTAHSQRREKASKLLTSLAQRLHSPRLAALAARVQLDAFTRVKQAIDSMVAELTKEKQDEIQHRDFCVSEFNSNELQNEKKTREESDLSSKIEDLEMTIDTLKGAIEALHGEISEMQVQLKRAGEDREKQNKEFQMTVADQRETQKLLQAAVGIMRNYYAQQKPASLAQKKQEPGNPPPPPGFETYKKNAGSSGVIGLLDQIINDAKAMEVETIRAEEDAQKAYEDFVKQTNGSIATKNKDILHKTKEQSEAEQDLVADKESKKGVMTELEQLGNYKGELHLSCDFVLKNFDIRQTARDEEIEALRQAKAILSGARFEDFLQGKSS